MPEELISIENGVTRHPQKRMAEPVTLTVERGQHVAIVGGNAEGKSRLVDILTSAFPLLRQEVHYGFGDGRLAADNIRVLTFRDSYGEADQTYYLQQRWNQHDIAPDAPRVEDVLPMDEPLPFGLEAQRGKLLISLSSGELRKLQLARALSTRPQLLVMDNPFIGLDAEARRQLRDLLGEIAREGRVSTIIVLSRLADVPPHVTHILPVEGLKTGKLTPVAKYTNRGASISLFTPEHKAKLLSLPPKDLSAMPFYPQSGGEILALREVKITYGEHTILGPLTWHVCEGERWALTGPNGSGKSTLLSLLTADNPQAYACNISLFGHQRGTGESIWEIKRHIGYVSPEMHRAYQKDLPAIDIVASGLSDSVGLYKRPTPSEREQCMVWLSIFGIEALAQRPFLQLSSGEQRLCLLARAFVKDPELLILDEPLHGLDERRSLMVRDIIETFCSRPHKTLIMVSHYEEELPPIITHRLTLKKQ